jgi:DNA-binding PadR family transcriptional regulator
MSIIGKTKLAILKELSKEPLHGYILSKRLKITVSSVYAHLDELEKEGLIASSRLERRKIYFLTEKGKDLLKILVEDKPS